jgi:hypothetical protein
MIIEETSALVADSWRLHYGDDIDENGTSKAYYKAVDRMAFVSNTVKNVVKPFVIAFTTLAKIIQGVTAIIAPATWPLTVDPMKTTLFSKAYKGRQADSGKRQIYEDEGQARKYDTAPNKDGSEYRKAFENRGEWFMGCHEPERLTCGASLSSDNPFGDYVVPPPQQQ